MTRKRKFEDRPIPIEPSPIDINMCMWIKKIIYSFGENKKFFLCVNIHIYI